MTTKNLFCLTETGDVASGSAKAKTEREKDFGECGYCRKPSQNNTSQVYTRDTIAIRIVC